LKLNRLSEITEIGICVRYGKHRKSDSDQQQKEFVMESNQHREPWNKGKLIGQKPPLKPKDIWAIRIHLQNQHLIRDLAMFNLAIDSKLRGCDLVNLRVRDITHGNQILARAELPPKISLPRVT
jgi:hypothetical protein